MQTANSLPAAILLDRDGVINEDSKDYIKSADEWLPIPGSIEAIARLCGHGIPVAICTNQAGIARGLFNHRALAGIHAKLCNRVTAAGGHIAIIRYCAHGPNDRCRCRKPQAGMLLDVCRGLNVEPSQCWFVGDSEKDLLAARAANCHPVLVRTGNGLSTESTSGELAGAVYDNLHQAVGKLLDV